MDAALRNREQNSDSDFASAQGPGADDIFSHMSAYMEVGTQ
jgi:hypothetical protein